MAIHKDTYGDSIGVTALPDTEEPRIYLAPALDEGYEDLVFSVSQAQVLADDILQQIELATGE